MNGKLSIVATPIGNLKDITLRALETLKACDRIACEDTRVTSKLLTAHTISKPLLAIHVHSTDRAITNAITRMKDGEHVVYVSDAGTPNLNDPGGKLAAAAFEAGIPVEPIPGASAITTAISACGFPMDTFMYLGFVPQKKGRSTFFTEITGRTSPSIFLESTHRIEKTLAALEETLQTDRLIFVGRELTKLHETLYRGTAADVRQQMAQTSTKGEFVIIVGPAPKRVH